MKPSERRALEAEKRAQREAEVKERSLQSDCGSADDGNSEKREGFFSKHVRIITFAICVVLILTVLGPWSIDRLVTKHRESIFGSDMSNKEDITPNDIVALARLGETLTWNDLNDFNYNDLSQDYLDEVTNKKRTEYRREYAVDGMLVVRVIGNSLSGRPASVQLLYYGKDAEVMNEIRGKDVTDFLTRHGYLK